MTTPTDEELDALDKKLASQIGDDVQAIFDHEQLFKQARSAITALRTQLAEVRAEKEKLGWEVNTARYGQPDFSWQLHKEALAEANAQADRTEAALAKVIRSTCACAIGPNAEQPVAGTLLALLKERDEARDLVPALLKERDEARARAAPSLRITGPNSDGEYWLHIKAGGRSGGVNLGGEHGPICKRLLDAASETGAKE